MFNAPPSVIAASKRAKLRKALMELLIKEKKEEITIKCGLKILDMIMNMSEYIRISDDGYVSLAGCSINVERDFDLDPWHIIYNDEVLFSF
jgi:hypothetical protein